MKEYEKIKTLYERDDNTKKLLEGKYRDETVEFLKDLDWEFTEKIDGTNIRICWDGHKVQYLGRTDKAQIPSKLMNKLIELFGGETNEEIFEQHFGETEVMLIGEGYGEKIQKCGSEYTKENNFILFDVCINGNYQPRDNVEKIASYFNIDTVPVIMTGKLEDGVEFIKKKPKSTIGTANMEGLVARPKFELQDRCGNRLIVKIKARDFEQLEEN